MTDGNTGGAGGAGSNRLHLVLGGGLAAVLLAAIGATAGWVLAGEDDVPPENPRAVATATGGPSGAPTRRPTATRSTPSAPRTSASTGNGLTVPPVIGLDFMEARSELQGRRLGWRLEFGDGTGRTVGRTSPEVGAEVKRGTTVTLYVTGPAPTTTVPDLVGEDCADAAEALGQEGFYPRYPSGRHGAVSRQDPPAGGTARWNDEVHIWCGAPSDDEPTTKPPL